MREIINFLNYHTKLYDEGHPQISDKEWDDVYFKLQEMEKETGIIYPDSPTQSISYNVQSELTTVKHNHFMLSAAKTKDWSEFTSYFGDKAAIGMLKMDGLTLSLKYAGGRLISAETRGNGTEGEDVTHNARTVWNIPTAIPYTNDLIIDGEIICDYNSFENFKEDYANPRNFASGSIRLLDANECAKRQLTFVAWNIVEGFNGVNSFLNKLELLKSLGFTVVPYTSSLDLDAKEFLIDVAEQLAYPIDGLVARFDDVSYGKSLGNTSHHSKSIYAFKFYDDEVETELIDIEWSMGKDTITPVAIYKEVELLGSTCSRASVHNISVLKETFHGIPFIGQKIKICKKNEIIPQIIWSEEDNSLNNPYLLIPNACPCCGAFAEQVESASGTINLVCTNPSCDGKLITRLDHFAGKKGMDIKGLSEATLEKLIDWGWISSITDIFLLFSHEKEWASKPGFGNKSVNNILTAINNSRNTELWKFISSLSIPLIGSTVAKDIANRCSDNWEVFRAFVDDNDFSFEEWDGFGPEMNKALKKFDYSEADELINNSIITIVTIEEDNAAAASQDLTGLVFVITGKSGLGSRDDVKKLIEKSGAKVASSVTGKTNYLVANQPENTAKYNGAVERGIPIINDTELIKLLGI